MKKTVSNAATSLLAICALVVTGLVVKREFLPEAVTPERVWRSVQNWEGLAATGLAMGPERPLVRIVEFSDFQCPFCARANASLRELRERYPEQVAVVYRHFPLEEIHPHAFAAALATECAGEQGRFEPFHDLLFARQDSIGVKDWASFAEDAGVADLAKFQACVEEEKYRPRLEEDIRAAQRIGVTGTPSFVFDGQMVSGALSTDELEEWVRGALP